ncbi:MAG: hypothetical protein ACREMZ_05320 [Gemmatimonadales bacterium]
MSRAFLLLLLIFCARELGAQGTVVLPQPPLDSARASLRDGLLVLRDSLNSIDAAASRLQRDYRGASAAALLSRARVMRDACARSARTVVPTRETVAAALITDPRKQKRRGELIQALDRLQEELTRCHSDFAALAQPGQGEQVRGYGNQRAVRVQAALRTYAPKASAFLAAMGIRVAPLGAAPSPLAS